MTYAGVFSLHYKVFFMDVRFKDIVEHTMSYGFLPKCSGATDIPNGQIANVFLKD